MNRHLFSKAGFGSLELILGDSFKQVYRGSVGVGGWKVEGLDREPQTDGQEECLFEYQAVDYSYTIGTETSLTPPFRLLINDRLEKESSLRIGQKVHLLTGRFSIKDAVGMTSLQIVDARGRVVFLLETEVYPQKMDYASDYKAMLAEITSIVHNLTYDALKDTFRMARARVAGHTTELEWWSILDELFDKLIKNLNVITKQPKHEIRYTDKVASVEHVTRASKHNLEWLKRNARHTASKTKGLQVTPQLRVTHALTVRNYVTYDTYENRFVAWALRGILKGLRNYKRTLECIRDYDRYDKLLRRISFYQGRLQSILHSSPFSEVSHFEERVHFSTTMTRGAGYRDFMVIHLLLTRGLELWDNDVFRVGQKNVSTLYEYWSYLKLVQLIKEKVGQDIDLRDLIKVNSGRVKVTLRKGAESGVHFTDELSGTKASVFYNRSFTKASRNTYTFEQTPDISMRFQKSGIDQPFWVLFDGKYRFDEKPMEQGATYDAPQDAIGQLHRYRDAILHTEPQPGTYRRALKNLGGIILYPYPLDEARFVGTQYHTSIEAVNIGALPFLPGKTSLVSDYLTKLLDKEPMAHFEDFIEMDRTIYEDERKRWKDWVTIGLIPKSYQLERIDFFKNKRLVHIPFVRDTNSKLYASKELLICVAGTRNAFLCEVVGWEVMSSSELKTSGAKWPLSYDRYLVFSVKEHREVQTPVPIAPVRFRYSTHEGLYRYLASNGKDPELFYLTNADAARLCEQLKSQNVQFRCEWGQDEQDPSLVRFIVRNNVIKSSERFTPLHYQVEGKEISLKQVDQYIACT